MTFYAKALLYDTKLASQEERFEFLEKDFSTYLKTISQQLKKEFESYNEAVGLVCETAKISQQVFNQTYGNEPIDETAILNELSNQLSSPFISQRGFTEARAIEMFRNVANLALQKVKDQEI